MTTDTSELRRPTYAAELWNVTRLVLCFLAGVTLLFGAATVLNRFFGPVVAIIAVNAVFLAATIAVHAWFTYMSKLSDWNAQKSFDREMERLHKRG